MRCLVNYARRQSGLRPLARVAKLDRAADSKSGDILRCDEFDHEACGRPFTYWLERVGYLRSSCGAAENIAYGTAELASPRQIFEGWISSAGHRRNILGKFRHLGVGLREGSLDGNRRAHVWTQHFGTPC